MAAARQLSGGKAVPAMELLDYPPEVERAIKYAFGSVLICQVRGWPGRCRPR